MVGSRVLDQPGIPSEFLFQEEEEEQVRKRKRITEQ